MLSWKFINVRFADAAKTDGSLITFDRTFRCLAGMFPSLFNRHKR